MHISLLSTMPSITAWGFSLNLLSLLGNQVLKLLALMAISTVFFPSLLHTLLTTPNSALWPAVWRIDAPAVQYHQMSMRILLCLFAIEIPRLLSVHFNDTVMGNFLTSFKMMDSVPVITHSWLIFPTLTYSLASPLMPFTNFIRAYLMITSCHGSREHNWSRMHWCSLQGTVWLPRLASF